MSLAAAAAIDPEGSEPYRSRHELPQSVANILDHHVTFELECIDRMYLNVYVPMLQCESGVARFFRSHRGHQFASSALMDPMTKTFVASLDGFKLVNSSRSRWCSSKRVRARRQACRLNLTQRQWPQPKWRKSAADER